MCLCSLYPFSYLFLLIKYLPGCCKVLFWFFLQKGCGKILTLFSFFLIDDYAFFCRLLIGPKKNASDFFASSNSIHVLLSSDSIMNMVLCTCLSDICAQCQSCFCCPLIPSFRCSQFAVLSFDLSYILSILSTVFLAWLLLFSKFFHIMYTWISFGLR